MFTLLLTLAAFVAQLVLKCLACAIVCDIGTGDGRDKNDGVIWNVSTKLVVSPRVDYSGLESYHLP